MGMDPNQAWLDLANAIECNEWQSATEIAGNLEQWLLKGGNPPAITGKQTFDRIVTRSTIEAITTWEVA